jgi:hypothetical protein
MVSSMSLSLLLVVSLAAAISVVDAESYWSTNKNLRGEYYYYQTAPAPAPTLSIRILQGEDQPTNVPTLSPVIVEYWNITGDGYADRPDEDLPTDQEHIVDVDDLPTSDVTSGPTTAPTRTLNDGAQAEPKSVNDNENNKSKKSSKEDQKWIILVAVLTSAAFLLMLFLLVLVCRTRRRNRRDLATKQAVNGDKSATAAARNAANRDAPCDPTETDREYSEHAPIQETMTDSDMASETSSAEVNAMYSMPTFNR